jgi:ketosteroid isomerase-like protein
MSRIFDTPQDAEDAYYDALEEGDLEALLNVWDEADDISCILPMHPLVQGRSAVRDAFTRLFARGQGIALSVKHLGWIETGDVAIHHVEESPQSQSPGGQLAPHHPPERADRATRRQAAADGPVT